MTKKIPTLSAWFLFLSLALVSGDALAVSLNNIDTGVFIFGMELRADHEVDYTQLDLIFRDSAGTKEIKLFDDLLITHAGQEFIATDAQENFSAAMILLTNGESDWIKLLMAQYPRKISLQGTEPSLLYDDYTGNSGIDFAGLTLKRIKLQVTAVKFTLGFDQVQGPFTDIKIEGRVSIILKPETVAMFSEAFGSLFFDFNYSIFSDADRDGDVDGTDLSQKANIVVIFIESFAAAYGAIIADSNYRILGDADDDGDIDGVDLLRQVQIYAMSPRSNN